MPESSSVAYTVGGDSSTNSAELSVSWTSVTLSLGQCSGLEAREPFGLLPVRGS